MVPLASASGPGRLRCLACHVSCSPLQPQHLCLGRPRKLRHAFKLPTSTTSATTAPPSAPWVRAWSADAEQAAPHPYAPAPTPQICKRAAARQQPWQPRGPSQTPPTSRASCNPRWLPRHTQSMATIMRLAMKSRPTRSLTSPRCNPRSQTVQPTGRRAVEGAERVQVQHDLVCLSLRVRRPRSSSGCSSGGQPPAGAASCRQQKQDLQRPRRAPRVHAPGLPQTCPACRASCNPQLLPCCTREGRLSTKQRPRQSKVHLGLLLVRGLDLAPLRLEAGPPPLPTEPPTHLLKQEPLLPSSWLVVVRARRRHPIPPTTMTRATHSSRLELPRLRPLAA
mmetsp:Transcript_17854/g.49925  ORF Transcript_17854/g.49925 Transcript_17854/m.49925 type:complete len:337 (+) Transcript_17854:386-1396(+)